MATSYWIGNDGNVYGKGSDFNGVQNLGRAGSVVNQGRQIIHPNGVTTIVPLANFITNPGNPQPSVGSGGGGGGGGGGSAADYASEAAYWADQQAQLDQQLGRIDTQQNVGLGNIANSYNSGFQTLTNQQGQTNRDLAQSKKDTINDNITAKNSVDDSVRNNLTGIQRLLASRGAGDSSAYSILAPYAAATTGNQQRQQVQSAYLKNLRAEEQAQQDADLKFQSAFGDLLSQRQTKENELLSGLASARAGLQQQKADAALHSTQARGGSYAEARAAEAPFLSAVNSLLNQAAGLGTQFSFTPQKVDYTAPNLSAYTYDPTAAPTAGSGVPGGQASTVGPYWTLISNGDKKNTTQSVGPATTITSG